METEKEVKVYFHKRNCNMLVFEQGKKWYSVAIPPSKNCINILSFDGITKDHPHVRSEHYHIYNTSAYVIITSEKDRKIYHYGNLICETKLTY
jgi:hypothetical protein